MREKSVLIFGESRGELEGLRIGLVSAGLRVLVSGYVDEWEETVWDNQPDLVLLIASELEPRGMKACRVLKSNAKTKEIPLVFLIHSAPQQADKIGVFRAGCSDLLIQPISMDELLARIDVRLAGYETQRRLAEENANLQELLSTIASPQKKQPRRDVEKTQRFETIHPGLLAALHQMSEGIVLTDRDWVIQYTNPAFSSLSGYGQDELIGQKNSILRNEKNLDFFNTRVLDTLKGGSFWSGHGIQKRKDGRLNEVEVNSSPVLDELGNVINFFFIFRDVTVEVSLERQLRQVQKLEAIGTLAGGVAHDFNNILTAIIGFTDISLSTLSADHPLYHNLTYILEASHRASQLVKQILAFTRKGKNEREFVYIAPIIREALKMMRAMLPSTIEIRQEISVNPMVLADSSQIHQILVNLCTNAGHAMRTFGGVLKVQLIETEVGNDQASPLVSDLLPGRYVELTVNDTGCGMNEAVMERIFDPYFTTKEPDEGTGLGLAVVDGIVKSYGGVITVDSQPGKGSTFHVYLAVAREDAPVPINATPMLSGEKERILFVDDEELLANLGKQVLEKLGYRVTIEMNGLTALETFRSQPDAFDLVITDMTMPGLTGKDLAGEIMAIRPDIPIILCTGYSQAVDEQTAIQAGIRGFIMKPIMIRKLSALIRKVLMKEDKTKTTENQKGWI